METFLSELIMAVQKRKVIKAGTILIRTVKGDVHTIGRNGVPTADGLFRSRHSWTKDENGIVFKKSKMVLWKSHHA